MEPIASSFRDPSGFLFVQDGHIYRQVNNSYKDDYDQLMNSGLYEKLVDDGLMVRHEERPPQKDGYKVLKPEQLKYISYPYEWCFSQLKDSALLTLDIQLLALEYEMTLKDASAYNVHLHQGKPCFIDTLSFERYTEGEAWVAYRQFCQHFLAPLALIAHCDFRLNHLLRSYIDGIPLDLASKLLPGKSWFNYGLLAHLHLHAMSQKRYEDDGRAAASGKRPSVSRLQLRGLIESLRSAVNKLTWQPPATEWGDYYADTNYVDEAMLEKESLVKQFVREAGEKLAQKDGAIGADFGGNTGKFSRLVAEEGFYVLSHDIDEVAVEKNYRQMISAGETNIQPLLLDLTNPSPGLGWANEERDSTVTRSRVDVGLALALVHHLAISNNVPLERVAKFFHSVCDHLVIEFVPKSDSQVKRLLATRDDIFPDYTNEGFAAAFERYFETIKTVDISGTDRKLYLFAKRQS